MRITYKERAIDIIFKSNYKLLLFILMFFILIMPSLIQTQYGNFLLLIVSSLILLSIVFTTLDNRGLFYFACGLAIFTMASDIVMFWKVHHGVLLWQSLANIAFYIFAIVIILKNVFSTVKITADTVFAALSVYLLIGIVYGSLYFLIALHDPEAFLLFGQTCAQACKEQYLMFYYSFITLTTVGYGDLVPVSAYARAFAMLEGITGVLYLAAMVSRVVSGMVASDR